MKNKNKRELEKYWAEQAAKKAKAAKKQPATPAESKEPVAEDSNKAGKK